MAGARLPASQRNSYFFSPAWVLLLFFGGHPWPRGLCPRVPLSGAGSAARGSQIVPGLAQPACAAATAKAPRAPGCGHSSARPCACCLRLLPLLLGAGPSACSLARRSPRRRPGGRQGLPRLCRGCRGERCRQRPLPPLPALLLEELGCGRHARRLIGSRRHHQSPEQLFGE